MLSMYINGFYHTFPSCCIVGQLQFLPIWEYHQLSYLLKGQLLKQHSIHQQIFQQVYLMNSCYFLTKWTCQFNTSQIHNIYILFSPCIHFNVIYFICCSSNTYLSSKWLTVCCFKYSGRCSSWLHKQSSKHLEWKHWSSDTIKVLSCASFLKIVNC